MKSILFYPSLLNVVSYANFKDRCRRNGGKCSAVEEMVGVPGVEPGTSSLSGTRSNQLSYTPGCDDGGGNGIRTRDFQLAKLALYQLSYAPVRFRARVGPSSVRTPTIHSVQSCPKQKRPGKYAVCVRLAALAGRSIPRDGPLSLSAKGQACALSGGFSLERR